MSNSSLPPRAASYLAAEQKNLDAVLDEFEKHHLTPSQREFWRTVRNAASNAKSDELSDDERQVSRELAQCALVLHEYCVQKGWFADENQGQRSEYFKQVGLPPGGLDVASWKEILSNTFLFRRFTEETFDLEFYPVMRVPASDPSGLWGILDSMPLTLEATEYKRLARNLIQAAQNVRG